MKKILKGRLAEKIAQRFLEKRGFQILAKNLRLKNLGEIDLLAEKNNFLNFVEVKSLFSSKSFLPEFHFNQRKKERIEKLAKYFCLKFKKDNYFISLIALSFWGKKIKIRYYENI